MDPHSDLDNIQSIFCGIIVIVADKRHILKDLGFRNDEVLIEYMILVLQNQIGRRIVISLMDFLK